MTKIDKRDRAALFRARLAQAMQTAGVSQSALARGIAVDRSTISQLLAPDAARLPGAQVVAECAALLRVSADWLLGLSDRPESAADLLATSLSLSQAPRAPVDEQVFAWHQAADGYKIRHVPAALPDMLKTREMLEWEYRPHLGKTTEQAIGASEDRLAFLSRSKSDFEIAWPAHELESLVSGAGYYAGLSVQTRRAQLAKICELYDRLYPALRIHIFDARQVFSAPITIFGPMMAVLYVGQHYIAFRDTERVNTFSQQFDGLVRAAKIAERDVLTYIDALGGKIR